MQRLMWRGAARRYKPHQQLSSIESNPPTIFGREVDAERLLTTAATEQDQPHQSTNRISTLNLQIAALRTITEMSGSHQYTL